MRKFARATGRVAASSVYPLLTAIHRVYREGARQHALGRFKEIGHDVGFNPLNSVIDYESLSVGNNVYIGWGAYLFGPIRLGDDVMLGPEVHIQAGYHRFDVVGASIRDSGGDERAEVVIERDVWIGARASVMKGVTVGEGSVVGTGSIVLHDVPPYVIAVGTPCRAIRKRFEDEELRTHLAKRGYDRDETERLVSARASGIRARGS